MTCEFQNFCALSSSEQASWVQAIGSVVAIAIAIAVPILIDHLNKKRLNREKSARSKVLALSILPDLYRLKASTIHFIVEQTNTEAGIPREIDRLNGDYFSHAGNFKSILTTMPDLSIYGEKLSGLVYLLFRAHEMASSISRLQASGYHAAYINNIDEYLKFAQEIDNSTADLISAIENSYKTSENS